MAHTSFRYPMLFCRTLAISSQIVRLKARSDTHCKPIRLNVKSAMRIDSVEPLMDGVPAHEAA